ncbi:hypothetical protein BN1723_012439 [Verticillium longisporum]|uniref:Uncharacterized protein n=1 Tax=Verticillium longisporum TaxID=100787 RepID=A0A0G4LI42_VERLO|nr:hypothetical protein BN1723_012439 [Verticillium longisporum]
MVTESPLLPRPTRHFQRRKTQAPARPLDHPRPHPLHIRSSLPLLRLLFPVLQLSSSPLSTTTPSRFPNLQRPTPIRLSTFRLLRLRLRLRLASWLPTPRASTHPRLLALTDTSFHYRRHRDCLLSSTHARAPFDLPREHAPSHTFCSNHARNRDPSNLLRTSPTPMVTESPLLPRPTRHFQRRKTQGFQKIGSGSQSTETKASTKPGLPRSYTTRF